MNIKSILHPDRIKVIEGECSKKRALDILSKILASSKPDIDSKTLLQQFIARERLGSTAIGHGVALPHIRLSNIDKAEGACVLFKTPLDFDGLDKQDVSIVFGLIVPETATEEHLQILSQLATLFNDSSFRNQLRQCNNDIDLYQHLTKHKGLSIDAN